MQKDMTKGNPLKLMLLFIIPIFIGNIFQQFYSMADSIIVSRLLGVEALAAVGSTTGFSFMVIGFSQGLTMGFSAIISQRFGAKDEKGLRNAYGMSILLCIGIVLSVSILFTALSKNLLQLVNTPENILEMADSYVSVIYQFLLFTVFYNFFSGVLRALGDSKSPLIFMIISSALNIVLDIISIVVLHLGVRGTAYATVFSQGVSAALCFIYIKIKFPILNIHKEDMKMNRTLCFQLLKVGIPGAVQYSITAISVIIVMASLNNFGSNTIAAYTVGEKVEIIFSQFFPALGIGISTFAAQNLGARDPQRIRKGFRIAILIDVVFSAIALVLAYIVAEPMSLLFLNAETTDPIVLKQAIQYVTTSAWFFIPLGFIFIFRTGTTGLGSGKIPMLSSILELFARTSTAFTLPALLGFAGLIYSNMFSWCLAGFILPFAYLHLIRKIQKDLMEDTLNSSR